MSRCPAGTGRRTQASSPRCRSSGCPTPSSPRSSFRLFASLLIPLLGIWLNRVEDGVFQIETFEFVNLIVGGLFAVIALNFTVNSTYQVLGSGDNPVSRLFALNYVALGISLMINVLMFRFNVVGRWFGRYVQEQLYLFLIWAVPLLMLVSAASVILVAMA
jgi:hypothetical protein